MYFGCENSALQRNQSAGSQEPSPHHEAARFPFGHGASTSSVPCRRWGEMADHQSPPSGRGDGKMGLTCGQPFYPSTILRNFSSSESCWHSVCLRAGLKIPGRAVFVLKVGWRGATRENTLHGSSTEEQRSQTACRTKILWTAGLLSVGGVGSAFTARSGDAQASPPCPQPKSPAAAPLAIFRPALWSAGRRLIIGRNIIWRWNRH